MRTAILTLFTTFAAAQSSAPVNVFRANDLKIVDGPHVESVHDRTAVIAWSTDVESSAIVRYGTNEKSLDQKAEDRWGGTKTGASVVHRVTLRDLKPAKKYWFIAESGEGWHRSKAIARSETQAFTTRSPGSIVPPKSAAPLIRPGNIVAGPLAMNVTDTSAAIWWMSADPMSGSVTYGTRPGAPDNKVAFKVNEKKSVALSGLQPDRTYYFQLRDTTDRTLADGSFTTARPDFADARFKIVRGPTVEVVGRDTATISWGTNARSSSIVHYGADPGNLDRSAMAPWGQREHRVVIKDLKPGTRYFFQVESAQAQDTGLAAKSNVAPFQTVEEGQSAMRNPDWQR